MTNRIVRYIAKFDAQVFNPKDGITVNKRYSCSVFLYPELYTNGTRLVDIALSHAWCKAISHFFGTDFYGIPLSIKVEDILEVKEND